MAFKDLDEFLVQPLTLPIRGKLYAFPGSISARSWLLLQRLGAIADAARLQGADFNPDVEVLNDVDQIALMSEVFGGVDKQMADDGLTSAEMNLVFATLMIYHLKDRDVAEAYWNARGEAAAPNRATRRQPAPKK